MVLSSKCNWCAKKFLHNRSKRGSNSGSSEQQGMQAVGFFSIPETIVVPVTFFRLPRQGKTIVLDLPLALHTSPYHAAAVGVIFHVPLSHGLPREWGQGTSAPMIKPAVNLKLCLEATTSNVWFPRTTFRTWNWSLRWRTDSALRDQHWTKISSVYKKTPWSWLDANQPWLWRWWMCRWKCNKFCNSICACF